MNFKRFSTLCFDLMFLVLVIMMIGGSIGATHVLAFYIGIACVVALIICVCWMVGAPEDGKVPKIEIQKSESLGIKYNIAYCLVVTTLFVWFDHFAMAIGYVFATTMCASVIKYVD